MLSTLDPKENITHVEGVIKPGNTGPGTPVYVRKNVRKGKRQIKIMIKLKSTLVIRKEGKNNKEKKQQSFKVNSLRRPYFRFLALINPVISSMS